MKDRKFNLISLILGVACVLFGVIGLVLKNDPSATPLILVAGALTIVYAFTYRMLLGKIIAWLTVVGLAVAAVFDVFVWDRTLHTWFFLALCLFFIIYLMLEIFIREREAKSVPVPHKVSEKKTEKPIPAVAAAEKTAEPPIGYYVIRKTSDNAYIFNLKAANHEEICISRRYATAEECRGAINAFRKVAEGAPTDDATRMDAERLSGKKFEIYHGDAKEFIFRLKDGDGQVLIGSQGYKTKDSCRRGIQSVQKNASSHKVIEAFEQEDLFVPDAFYEALFAVDAEESMKKQIEEVRETAKQKMAAIQMTSAETYEDVEGGVEAVGIVFPERDRVYFYGPAGNQFKAGDIVLVPTRTTDRIVCVTVPNVHLPEDKIVRPFKDIIEVVTTSGNRTEP